MKPLLQETTKNIGTLQQSETAKHPRNVGLNESLQGDMKVGGEIG